MCSMKDVRVVLLGKTGAGKSSLGNMLLGRNAFLVECSFSSVTFSCQWACSVRYGLNLQVTDTPGLNDTGRGVEEVMKELGKSVAATFPGPHVILIVLRCGLFTDEEYQAYLTLKHVFGDGISKFLVIVFTGCDTLPGETADRMENLQAALTRAPPELQQIMQDAGGRYIGVDNAAPADDRQRQAHQVIKKMEELMTQNGGDYFTNDLCQDVHSRVHKMVQKQLQIQQVTPEEATSQVRQDIMAEMDNDQFFDEMGNLFKRRFMPVFKNAFVGVLKNVTSTDLNHGCSVM